MRHTLKDAETPQTSKDWESILWKNHGQNFSYEFHEEDAWKFIQNRAESS